MENFMVNSKPNYYYRSLLNNKIHFDERGNEKATILNKSKRNEYINSLKEKSIFANSHFIGKSIPRNISNNFFQSRLEIYQMKNDRIKNRSNENVENAKLTKNKLKLNNINRQITDLLYGQNTLPFIKYKPLDRITIPASFLNIQSKSNSINGSSKSKKGIVSKLEPSKSVPSLEIDNKKKQFMEEYYNRNLRFLNRRSRKNIASLIYNHHQVDLDKINDFSEIHEDTYNQNESKLITSRYKIKKVFIAILAIVKLNWNVNKPEVFAINSQAQKKLFLNNNIESENELRLADEAKELLKLKVDERTEENIKAIVFYINFVVPEFAELPTALQYRMAQFGFYEEYEPERVIIRQGHHSEKFYFIIAGTVDLLQATQGDQGEVKQTLLNKLKRGDCFGEVSLINKQKRTSTVVNNSEQLLGLLSFEKDHYFKMQHLINSKHKTFEFLKSKVEIFKKLEFPFEKLLKVKHDYLTLFYRKNTLVCEDSVQDKWFFVIKSGKAKVLKKIRLSFEEYMENFRMTRQTTDSEIMRFYKLEEKKLRKEYKYLFDKYTFVEKINQDKYAYLMIDTLKQGDMFAFPDMVLKDDIDYNSSYMLVSDGAECILIDKENFLRTCPAQSYLKLRYFVQLYPDDEYFSKKYFHNFKWANYKEGVRNSIVLHDPILNKKF